MEWTFSGWLFVLSGILMGLFSNKMYGVLKKNPTNTINYYYWLASLCITIGLSLYGLPSVIFGARYNAIMIGGEIATIINALGFFYFLMIPLYTWAGKKRQIFIHYIGYMYIILIAIFNILYPQQSFLDDSGIIHWRFNYLVSIPVVFLQAVSSIFNVVVLGSYFKRLSSLSAINTITLIVAFLFTATGGSYLYLGDSSVLLFLAAIALLLGLCFIFFSIIRQKTVA